MLKMPMQHVKVAARSQTALVAVNVTAVLILHFPGLCRIVAIQGFGEAKGPNARDICGKRWAVGFTANSVYMSNHA